MGASYHSHALIGLRVPRHIYVAKAFDRKDVKTFPHDFAPAIKFHPQNGQRLWKEELTPFEDVEKVLSNFTIVTDGEIDRHVYICVCYAGNEINDNGGPYDSLTQLAQSFSISEWKKRMQNELEPLGLWNEKEFGLWAVLDIRA